MTREEAVAQAALYGLTGLTLLSVGSVVASGLFFMFARATLLAAVPAMIIWLICAYFGMRQFAHGIYEIIEDA